MKQPLPDVHFGSADAALPQDWNTEDSPGADDELLAETPRDVVEMLGFDPLEYEQEMGKERNDSVPAKAEGEREYGDVKFADPKDAKYPIDTEEHIRAAWSYIHQGRDADKYSADDLAAVKRRIVSAWKEKIDPEGPPEAASRKDSDMANDIDEAAARKDAEIKELREKLDAACARLDAIESHKPAPEMPITDKKDGERRDGEEPTEAEREAEERERRDAAAKRDAAKRDAAKRDAEDAEAEEARRREEERTKKDAVDLAALQAEVKALRARTSGLETMPSRDDLDALAAAQARADSVYSALGEKVLPPLHGEKPIAYRRRVAAKIQHHSQQFAKAALDMLDPATFEAVENSIYADAMTAAMSPASAPAGGLRPVVRNDGMGHIITEYVGDNAHFLSRFRPPVSQRARDWPSSKQGA